MIMKTVMIISFLIVLCPGAAVSQQQNPPPPLYESLPTDSCCTIIYSDTTGNEYLRAFRKEYQLERLIEHQEGDLEKAIGLLHWTTSRWQHNGGRSAGTVNAFEILQRADAGEGFSCAEFAVVFATAANAVGIPARVVNLRIREAETATSGAGHSLAEVYIREYKKWVMMDPQSDLVAFMQDRPLSALELRMAIDTAPQKVKVLFKGDWGSEDLVSQVINWYSPYLYFYDIAFDNRPGAAEKRTCRGNPRLFLVPEGEKTPEVFQNHYPLKGFTTTHSIADFYQDPVLEPEI